MGLQVVEDDGVAGPEDGHERVGDGGPEACAVGGSVEQGARCGHAVLIRRYPEQARRRREHDHEIGWKSAPTPPVTRTGRIDSGANSVSKGL